MQALNDKYEIISCTNCGKDEMELRKETEVHCAHYGTWAKSLEPKLENEFMR